MFNKIMVRNCKQLKSTRTYNFNLNIKITLNLFLIKNYFLTSLKGIQVLFEIGKRIKHLKCIRKYLLIYTIT